MSAAQAPGPVRLTYYSDVLCIWAHLGQARVDEVVRNFGDQVAVEYRFCSVFGDSAHKVGAGWASRGGYQGFNAHLREVAAQFDYPDLHPDVWLGVRPASSASAHLALRAAASLEPAALPELLVRFRHGFFRDARDIARWDVQRDLISAAGIPAEAVRKVIDDGSAFAAMDADLRDAAQFRVPGSPTFLLNEGRQTLYGNVGYRIIEANIRELLQSPAAGAASWC